MKIKCKESKKGFTLVELLVVISIIALLLAVLMPALGRAKEAAKCVTCATNVKGLGMGWRFYAFDNQDWFPIGWGCTEYAWWKEARLGGIEKYLPTKSRWAEPTEKKVSEQGVWKGWYCPKNAEEAIKCTYKQGIAVGYQFNFCIGYMRYSKLSAIANPGKVPLLFCYWDPKPSDGTEKHLGNYGSYPSSDPAKPFTDRDYQGVGFNRGVPDVHGRGLGTNFLFVDGHIKRVPPLTKKLDQIQIEYAKAFSWEIPSYAYRVMECKNGGVDE